MKKTTDRKIRELKRKVRQALGLRNTFGDRIIIEDEVLVYEGDKLLFKSRGHIVSQGLIGIVNIFGATQTYQQKGLFSGKEADTAAGWSNKTGGVMHVGTGTGVTTAAMSSLVVDEGTDPDSQSGNIASPAAGTYRVSWNGTWNAGSLAAIDVSELGLLLCFQPTLEAFESMPHANNKTFFSRLSDADGDFTTFTVNIAVPLAIEWRLTFSFA